ncbi:MAG: amidohydrolase family protein [Acidimicrobiales bacterium]
MADTTVDTSIDAAEANYVVVSADCHGGASIRDYRPYLESRYHDDFDAWVGTFDNPYDDVKGADADRNWDSDRRLREMEADGIVGEVIFPNTIPPFFPKVSLLNQAPGASTGDLERRWAGLRAHNRWLADFCAAAPGRRAGICQIMLHDVAGSVDEIRWAHEHGLTGGVLLPGAPPGSGVPPLYAPDYEPIWAVCDELGMPVNHHSGSAAPDMGDYPAAQAVFLLEVTWWAHRSLWHLIFAGVMERHPDLQFVFTEQGTAWIPEELTRLDYYAGRLAGAGGAAGSQEARFGAATKALSLKPSEYWARQCHLGSSFIRRHEVDLRDQVGVDRIMWGSDFPHLEGCWPFSRQHLRVAFADVPTDEVRAMVGTNAARLYQLDLAVLEPLAAQFGPSPAEVATALPPEDIPDEALRCPAFAAARFMGR